MNVPTAPTALIGTSYRLVIGTRASRVVALLSLLLIAVLLTLPAWAPSGVLRFLVEVLVFLALAQMWNLVAGYAGLVSIGQQAFVGIGAYGLFALSDIAKIPAPVAAFVAAVVAGALALVISPFVFRLAGGYFAIGTWVVAEVLRLAISHVRGLGAGTGVSVQSLIAMPPAERQAVVYLLALGLGIASILLVTLIMRSRLGLALMAVRDGEPAARSLGVDVFRAKLAIWVIAAMGCAAAGAIFYMQALRIQPSAAFGVDWMAKIIFIVVIGGVGRIEGPILGTIAFFVLQTALAGLGAIYLVILGGIAIVVTLFAPQGLWGLLTERWPVSLFPVQRRLEIKPRATSR